MATINDSALIIPSENSINVDGEHLVFNYTKPDKIGDIPVELIATISWKWYGESKIDWYEDILYGEEYHETFIEENEENYNKYIKPFTDQWEAEKDRIEQEQQAAAEEYAKFSSRQIRAYDLVNRSYNDILNNGYVTTSLGYDADISTASTASLLGTKFNLDNDTYDSANFVDYHDLNRQIDSVKCNTIISEINQTQNHLRDQKQDFIAQIKNTTDNESLNTLLPTLKFTTLDFTQDTSTTGDEDMPKQYKEIPINQLDLLSLIDRI